MEAQRERMSVMLSSRAESRYYVLFWALNYTWFITFISWWTAFPAGTFLFGSTPRAVMHIANLVVSSVFCFAVRRNLSKRATGFSLFMIMGALVVAAFFPRNGAMLLLATVVMGGFVGAISQSSISNFSFLFSDGQQVFAAVLATVITSALMAFYSMGAVSVSLGVVWYTAVALPILLLLLGFTRKVLAGVFEGKLPSEAGGPAWEEQIPTTRQAYATLFLSCAYFILCRSLGISILHAANGRTTENLLFLYYVGSAAGAVLIFLIYRYTSAGIQTGWNLTFACPILALLLIFTCEADSAAVILAALLLGVSSACGIVNVNRMTGMIARRYRNKAYLRISVGVCNIAIVTGIFLGRAVALSSSQTATLVTSILAAVVLLAFLAISPHLYANVFSVNIGTPRREGDEAGGEKQNPPLDDLLARYSLTNRERDICKELLQGRTLRQTAAELAIAYSTVSTHCASIYRKLNINSRTELIVMFREYGTGCPRDS